MAAQTTASGKYDIYIVDDDGELCAVPPVAIITNRHVKVRNLTAEDLEIDFRDLGKPDNQKRAPARGNNEQDLKEPGILSPPGIYKYSVTATGSGRKARGNSEPKVIVDP